MILLCLTILVLWVASYVQLRHTFRWWCAQRLLEQQQQAEQMQDGILQDLFCIRRSLELANPTDLQPQQQVWLSQLEQIQRSIEQVGQYLSPAYVETSLPLAIQYAFNQWHVQHPQVTLQLDLPSAWEATNPAQDQFVLVALHQLLQLTDQPNLSKLQVRLTHPQSRQELVIQMSYPDSATRSCSHNSDFVHLGRSFRLLTGGDCQFRREASLTHWCFRW